jgi:hypothetical protein
VTRWEHEAVLEALEARLDKKPEHMRVRRQTAEHPFGLFNKSHTKCFLTRKLLVKEVTS